MSSSSTFTVFFDSNGGSYVAPITGLNSGDTISEPSVPTKTGAANVFEGWYDKDFQNKFDFSTPIVENITLYAKWDFLYQIGDTGPGGGIIFYRSDEGFTMTDDNSTAHYLEAAQNDTEWLSYISSVDLINTELVNGTAVEIGTGRNNTAWILSKDENASLAKFCKEYNNNGKSDWFLPNREELRHLYINRDHFENLPPETGVNANFYYSSSLFQTEGEYAGIWAYVIMFDTGNSQGNGLEYGGKSRPIRAF